VEISEALTVTVLGMSVVFVGLILTSLVIVAFSAVPRLLTRRVEPLPGPEAVVADEPGDRVPPEVLTVIATVLEVERRLAHLTTHGRLTIARGAGRPA
jgi:Na+-transporting methylmalonyl-CoA/oxaloacetate decarboxylase gamma subunit